MRNSFLIPLFQPAVAALLILVSTARSFATLTPELVAHLPAPTARPIDFARDIQPIFEVSCVQCHARGKSKGSFSLETRTDFLIGGDSGEAAIPGKSTESRVIEMISGLNPDILMPQKGKQLTREQIADFRAWIDQGLVWPEEITFFKTEPANLHPRDLAPPGPDSRFDNPLDQLIDTYFAKSQVAWNRPVDDATYARRVWLDTIGILPPHAELDAFLADTARDKRTRLVQRLLGDNQRYAEHWLTFWNDLLRNDYKGPGYTDGGRKPITGWLYSALARNLRYDAFVAQLLDPGAEAEGFTNGILWRGAVNASMVPPMQAAQGIAQVFLGVNLKCASCHDSFINEYTLDDAYGIAAVYADGPLEIAECDKPTGHTARVKFLYEELGAIDDNKGAAHRRQQLADIITGRKNGRLPRTIVNRIWQRFMGFGLVEPVDEMDKPAWSPEVIDWLAEDLVAHGYDLKHTMTRILTSRAYQLPAVNLGEVEENYVFRGPAVRRLSAEQFADAVFALTGLTHDKTDARLNRNAALTPSHDPLPLQPKWIWATADAHLNAKPVTLVFRRELKLARTPTEAHFAISADDNYNIKINGKVAGSSARRNTTRTDWIDVKSYLRTGDNQIEITAANMPPDEGRLVSVKTDSLPDSDSPAGLILYARLRAAGEIMDLVSDRGWTVSAYSKPPNTASGLSGPPDLGKLTELGAATELGDVDLAPWKLGQHFLDVAAAAKDTLPIERASLVNADPLTIALGRPNREQFITVRQATATTLQALELTNGATLATLLKRGAKNILASRPGSSRGIAEALYRQSVSRSPSAAERTLAEQLVGSPITSEGIEDFLWVLAMLPEFQLIH